MSKIVKAFCEPIFVTITVFFKADRLNKFSKLGVRFLFADHQIPIQKVLTLSNAKMIAALPA